MNDDDARSWSSYNVKYTNSNSYKPSRAKKIFHGIVLGVLTGAVLGLVYLNWYEAQIIARQRHLLIEMWYFIQNNCASPTSYTRF